MPAQTIAKSADCAIPGAQVFLISRGCFNIAPECIFHAHAFGDAPRETFEQGDHLIVEAIIVAEQNFHAGGGGTCDKNLFCGRFDRQDVIFVLEQHHRFGCRAIGQLTMFITGDHIRGDGCERHIFGGSNMPSLKRVPSVRSRARSTSASVISRARWLREFH